MTETKKNTLSKVLAGIVCVLGLALFLVSGVSMIFMASQNLYDFSGYTVEDRIDSVIAQNDLYRLLDDLSNGRDNEFRFNAGLVSPNLQYKIVSVGTFDDPYNEDEATVIYETPGFSGKMNEFVYGHEGYYYWTPDGTLWDIMMNPAYAYGVDENVTSTGTGYYAFYEVVDDLDYSHQESDLYCQARDLANIITDLAKASAALFVIGSILLVAGLVAMVKAADSELHVVHKIPYIFVLGALMGLGLLISVCVYALFYLQMDVFTNVTLASFAGLVFATFAVMCIYNTITRIKARSFWKNTLLGYIFRGLSKVSVITGSNAAMIFRLMCVMGVLTVVQICGLALFAGDKGFGLFLFFIYKLIAVGLVLYVATQAKKLRDGMKRVAAGNLSEPIDTKGMLADFKAHAEDINNAGEGIGLAVAESLKSERMKADLITNVSHDIKTPLTSIINYVDLLKKEDLKNDRADEYIEVLDRQSARLKKLTEDIVEASKASSGNIEMNIERVDLAVLLSQACGEFEEKFGTKGLELIKTLHQEQIYVNADGRYLWRIIDNLLRNIYKYAKNDTRIFLDTREKDGRVEVVFKNTSEAMLNITPQELTERFVRGDRSRNTEGSGLGLSIASSLAAGMGGDLKLDIDGDLFKAILDLQKAEDPVIETPEELPAIEAPVEE
ncbi:MAG: HAMP domain-containing histidine kinase [Clostridiales bacterium]|nr:HAMP domain-containing histidine kinase [Clostridiales bacterium]